VVLHAPLQFVAVSFEAGFAPYFERLPKPQD
jgi:hypothetical protein